jgi:hypothetical protein
MSLATGTGYVSNYNDSGYSYDYTSYTGGTSGTTTSSDTYTTTVQCGVYMINLGGGVYPINCSLTNIGESGIPGQSDDGWIVYPGYSIQVYQNTNYSTSASYT